MEVIEVKEILGNVFVVYGEGWNIGILGIVVFKLVGIYFCLVIVLGIDLVIGIVKGFGWSVDVFYLY